MNAARNRLALAALALSCAAAAPALAQSNAQSIGAEADISGYWEFETKRYDYGCKMTGEMTIAPAETEGEYVGELIAREKCDGITLETGEIFGPVEYYAEQTVVATRDGEALTIVSTLVRIDPPSTSYWPDDFVLEIIDGALMMGELRSADIAPVAFFRGDAPIA
ncbi:MAG: hypothetical protein PVI23_14615 [Maricaulaceae bacterium]|jgi:hypothetical protein